MEESYDVSRIDLEKEKVFLAQMLEKRAEICVRLRNATMSGLPLGIEGVTAELRACEVNIAVFCNALTRLRGKPVGGIV